MAAVQTRVSATRRRLIWGSGLWLALALLFVVLAVLAAFYDRFPADERIAHAIQGIDVPALGGFLAGATASGVVLGLMMSNSGAVWDNAKKYVEAGNMGGKGTELHKACVVGDTVGDPFKDTSGPAMNILIKLMTIVSLVFLPALM